MLTKQCITNCTLLLLFFKKISVIAKCGQLARVHTSKFNKFLVRSYVYYALEFSS